MVADTTDEYRARVMMGALNAVVDAGAIEGGGGGVVNLDIGIAALCDAIATLEAAAGVSPTLRQRRETAEFCRKRIVNTGSALAAGAARGEPLPWTLEAIGPRN